MPQIEFTQKEIGLLIEIINAVNVPGKVVEEVSVLKQKLILKAVPEVIKEDK